MQPFYLFIIHYICHARATFLTNCSLNCSFSFFVTVFSPSSLLHTLANFSFSRWHSTQKAFVLLMMSLRRKLVRLELILQVTSTFLVPRSWRPIQLAASSVPLGGRIDKEMKRNQSADQIVTAADVQCTKIFSLSLSFSLALALALALSLSLSPFTYM
jgi:hypothetical protein